MKTTPIKIVSGVGISSFSIYNRRASFLKFPHFISPFVPFYSTSALHSAAHLGGNCHAQISNVLIRVDTSVAATNSVDS